MEIRRRTRSQSHVNSDNTMMTMEDVHFLDSSGNDLGPVLTSAGRIQRLPEDSPALKGAIWSHCGQQIRLMFDAWVEVCPTPTLDGLVVYGYPKDHKEFGRPDNAAIYNADGTLRCRLAVPRPLTRYLPGTTSSADVVAQMQADGFWQIGRGYGDGIEDRNVPWMWADIGYGFDAYERRYFDPRSGKFDQLHFSIGRR